MRILRGMKAESNCMRVGGRHGENLGKKLGGAAENS